jgi:hypothetical protein
MNQSPNPWHLSFSYARALQNTVLKTWAGDDSRKAEAQAILGHRAKPRSAQLGNFVAGDVSESESESTYQKNYGEDSTNMTTSLTTDAVCLNHQLVLISLKYLTLPTVYYLRNVLSF